MNREQWLTEAAKAMEPYFKFRGFYLPKYRLTCGWPSAGGLGLRRRVVGQCHSSKSSKDGIFEIFVSPTIAENKDVTDTIAHELLHAAVGTEHGHAGKFKLGCKVLGLAGKPTSAIPGPKLREKIDKWVEGLGAYPHSAMSPILVKKPTKPNSTVKLVCDCGCIVRISPKWLEKSGEPICGCGLPFTVEE